MDFMKMIITSVISTITNIFLGIALTIVLVELGMQSLIIGIWMLLTIGIPIEVLVALGIIDKLRGIY